MVKHCVTTLKYFLLGKYFVLLINKINFLLLFWLELRVCRILCLHGKLFYGDTKIPNEI